MQMVPLFLRRINETLRLHIPIAYVREQNLQAGDQVLFIPEQNGDVRLRFVRMETLAEQAGADEVNAEPAE